MKNKINEQDFVKNLMLAMPCDNNDASDVMREVKKVHSGVKDRLLYDDYIKLKDSIKKYYTGSNIDDMLEFIDEYTAVEPPLDENTKDTEIVVANNDLTAVDIFDMDNLGSSDVQVESTDYMNDLFEAKNQPVKGKAKGSRQKQQ